MIRRVTESELPLCLRVIHEAFGTVAEEFGLTPDNCPTNGASVFPVPCAETAKRKDTGYSFPGPSAPYWLEADPGIGVNAWVSGVAERFGENPCRLMKNGVYYIGSGNVQH